LLAPVSAKEIHSASSHTGSPELSALLASRGPRSPEIPDSGKLPGSVGIPVSTEISASVSSWTHGSLSHKSGSVRDAPGLPDITVSPELPGSPDITTSPELPGSLKMPVPGSLVAEKIVSPELPGLPDITASPGSSDISALLSEHSPGSARQTTGSPEILGSPEITASLPSPLASSSPPNSLQLSAAMELEPTEPKIHHHSPSSESEISSLTSSPASVADIAPPDTEAKLVDEDGEMVESGEKASLVSKADAEAGVDDTQEACCDTTKS